MKAFTSTCWQETRGRIERGRCGWLTTKKKNGVKIKELRGIDNAMDPPELSHTVDATQDRPVAERSPNQTPHAETPGQPDTLHDFRLQAFRQAQDNLLRYQELFDFAPIAYLVTDGQGVIQQANHAAAAMLGGRKQFLVGVPLLFFVAPSERRAFALRLYHLGSCIGKQTQWLLKLCPHRAPGLLVHAMVSAAAAESSSVSPLLRWALRDITLQRQAEERLEAEKLFADSLVELADAVILVLDHTGHLVRGNRYFHELIGQEPGELIGCLLADLLLAEDKVSLAEGLGGVVVGNHNAHGTFRLRTRDQQPRTIAWSACNLTADPDREPTVLLVGSDITELQEAQRRALQVERLAAIGEMIAGLSHESRNALQRSQASLAILGLRLKDQPEALALVERVQRAQDDLYHLYENVRQYAAPIHLETRNCDLATLWREAWADLDGFRASRDADLREEMRVSNLHCEVSPHHLKGVFRNLLENALHATPGPVRVVMRCTPAEIDGREAVRIAIEDNGPGFDAEGRRKAFQPFFTTRLRGTGLGLPICRRLVEAHGGRISVGEETGRGAVILLTLPRRQP
jgi:PAS domain S-box-containing protein